MKNLLFLFLPIALLLSCTQTTKSAQNGDKVISVPIFSADSAYIYTKRQVDFGARVPNTKAHEECAQYLLSELRRHGAEVVEQKANLTAFDGTILKSTNIIGSVNPKATTRILLLSHWDSRPWADNDPKPENHKKPVMAANDGASGVGILLEIVRVISKTQPTVGVDVVFVDAEDYGQPEGLSAEGNEDSWCLGTQYWAKNPHVSGYTARYGILLDMVGAPGATFYREQSSDYYASSVVNTVWSQAKDLGFGQYFRDEKGGSITDDHIYVNKLLGIPTIDIIHFDPHTASGFGSYWHTTHDTMDNVDKSTLNAVGTTLLHVLYKEK